MSHPHIAGIYGVEENDDVFALVMELVEGEDLSQRIFRGAIPIDEALLGTAAYMSPEQAKRKVADKRTDIWAFGCVLYEMLTGKRAFDGEDVSEALAAVLRADPDWTLLPVATPESVRAIVRGCLDKDRKRRIGDIAVPLFLFAHPSIDASAKTAGGRDVWRYAATAAFVAVAMSALVAFAAWRYTHSAGRTVARFAIVLPEGQILGSGRGGLAALSPDGSQIAYVASGQLRTGTVHFNFSESGSLVYVPGPASVSRQSANLVLVDPAGHVELLKLPPAPHEHPRLSPDGMKIVFGTDDGKNADVTVGKRGASLPSTSSPSTRPGSNACTCCSLSKSRVAACIWPVAPRTPDGAWVTQQARQVAWALGDRAEPVRFLTRDHDRKFTNSFDAVFQAQGSRIIRTPIQVPQANAIGAVRSDGPV